MFGFFFPVRPGFYLPFFNGRGLYLPFSNDGKRSVAEGLAYIERCVSVERFITKITYSNVLRNFCKTKLIIWTNIRSNEKYERPIWSSYFFEQFIYLFITLEAPSLNKGYELNRISCLYQSYCLAYVYSGSWCASVESHFMNDISKAIVIKKIKGVRIHSPKTVY